METEYGREAVRKIKGEIGKVIVGQESLINGLLIGLFARGHVLIEGVPGLAKTLAVKTLAHVLDLSFKRIQFTPDLLPADLTGTMVFNQHSGEFTPRKGPVFANLILSDEINRAPAKVQSALLEAMEERQVTLGDVSYPLPEPFFVLATQNPIEQEGTYPLPEAQMDRFLLKVLVEYPGHDEELEILSRLGEGYIPKAEKILDADGLQRIWKIIETIHIDEKIRNYIVSIVSATRPGTETASGFSRYIEYGASPRASLYLYRCAKCLAFLQDRSYVLPEDIKAVAPAVLRHRIILSFEAESESLASDSVIEMVLQTIPVP